MLWLLLPSFMATLAFAQEDLNLRAVKKLEENLSTPVAEESGEVVSTHKRKLKYRHPFKHTPLEAVLESGTEYGHVKEGSYLIRLSDGKAVELHEAFYGKFYRLQDEHGFKYLQSNDGSCVYKMKTQFFNSVEPEIALYVPPLKYTPAPVNILKSDFDKKLNLRFEVTMLAGLVQGGYMKDLFNDVKASNGTSNQYGLHLATEWKLPIKVGGVFHYEKSTYNLAGSGKIQYSSPSFGPQFKTRDLDFFGHAIRFETQFRVSPFAKAYAQTNQGDYNFKFNSADLLLGAEYPVENRFGHFVWGLYYQSQWLALRDQPSVVSLNATNATNNSFGLSFAQVFE